MEPMKTLPSDQAFLAIPEASLCAYDTSRFVIQQVPYEHTSSYLQGSAKGPAAIVSASHFVEFYDEELDRETYRHGGLATLAPLEFGGKVDAEAVDLIEAQTEKLLGDKKFVVSLGAEHTVTLGFVRAHARHYPGLTVLQIDAHSDLRQAYHDNPYSHASVMARVNDLGLPIVQIGIRAQCREEADLIRKTDTIHTFYAHAIRQQPGWMEAALGKLGEYVYVTIDADGFDPSVVPAVGTAEPNGLFWVETLQFLKRVFETKNVVGFDVVEIAPREGDILSEYTMAKLVYRLIGYQAAKSS
jgi:agmatinase